MAKSKLGESVDLAIAVRDALGYEQRLRAAIAGKSSALLADAAAFAQRTACDIPQQRPMWWTIYWFLVRHVHERRAEERSAAGLVKSA